MPRDHHLGLGSERVHALNLRHQHDTAAAILHHSLHDGALGALALVSSFGAESVVLLHMLSQIAPQTPVLFIDTGLLFPETLDYQRRISDLLHLRDVRILRAAPQRLAAEDPDCSLHHRNGDACCALRKVEPLEQALSGFDGWITGRKRYQASTRETVEFFEAEGDSRIKVNPLARWGRDDIDAYMTAHRLPRHPLVAKGFPSIGCMPCTSAVKPDEDPRAGRWRNSEKTECGIHFINGAAHSTKARTT